MHISAGTSYPLIGQLTDLFYLWTAAIKSETEVRFLLNGPQNCASEMHQKHPKNKSKDEIHPLSHIKTPNCHHRRSAWLKGSLSFSQSSLFSAGDSLFSLFNCCCWASPLHIVHVLCCI